MWQTINLLDYADSSYIDGSTLKFNLYAWLGRLGGQNDYAIASVSFTDQLNRAVGLNKTIGPVLDVNRSSQTALLFRQTTDYVPTGARYATVSVTIVRVVGLYSNGNADNIALSLYQ